MVVIKNREQVILTASASHLLLQKLISTEVYFSQKRESSNKHKHFFVQ